MGRNNFRKNFSSDHRRYQEHDDRGLETARIRDRLGTKQVGFVDGIRGGNISKRNRGGPSRALNNVRLLPDDDFDLDCEVRSEQAGRARRGHGGMSRNWRGSNRGGRNYTMRASINPSKIAFSWSKVTIRNGAKYDKMLMLKELVNRSAVKFVPLCFQATSQNAQFYVEEPEAARAIKDLDRKVEMPDGFALQIGIERTTPPNPPLAETLSEKIKIAMARRYNAQTSALNLAAFHKEFAGESSYAPLWRLNIITKVLEVITDNIPEVSAIDLSNNRLTSLDGLVPMKTKLPRLQILYVNDNKLKDTRGVEKLKGLKLIELKLSGNELKDRLGASYIEEMRKVFPTLQVLDGKPLPKVIGFEDDGNDVSKELPASVPKLIKSEEAGKLVLQFLEQYFKLYDSDSRQPLLDAYDENAKMSMTAWGPYAIMKQYIEQSRNFIRVATEHRKLKLLHKGRLSIVSFLADLPKTNHDPTTFTLDLPFTSPTLMIFTVTGIFKERDTKTTSEPKHFNRCFIVVPRGSGFCIINETLVITNATTEDKKRAFTASISSMDDLNAAAAAAAASPSVVAPPPLDDATKRTLSTAFSEMSGMNLDWSVRCLEENEWNYDRATKVFQEKKALLPPEAFVRS